MLTQIINLLNENVPISIICIRLKKSRRVILKIYRRLFTLKVPISKIGEKRAKRRKNEKYKKSQ